MQYGEIAYGVSIIREGGREGDVEGKGFKTLRSSILVFNVFMYVKYFATAMDSAHVEKLPCSLSLLHPISLLPWLLLFMAKKYFITYALN